MNLLKKIPKSLRFACLYLFPVVMLFPLFFLNNVYANASEIGENLGSAAGKTVGTAIGSLQGITKGNAAGLKDGKAEGLSAKDTTIDITDIMEMGKLEVLVATTTIENLNKMGNDYAALYLLRGDVIFTVDLQQASFDTETDTLSIPQPMPTCYFDPVEIKKIAEYQKTFFSGSTEDGFTEYLNSLKQLEISFTDSIENYDNLLASAQTAAIHQVKQIAENMSVNSGQIHVKFLEHTQNER